MITEMNSTQEHNNVWQAPVKRILTELKDKPGALLPVLHAIQTEIGYVPSESVTLIAESLSLSRAEVHGVISFYTFFSIDSWWFSHVTDLQVRVVSGNGKQRAGVSRKAIFTDWV